MEQGHTEGLETAIFAGGCFWCLEAVFDRLQGVERVESGYMGGDVVDPSYEQVCQGDTGHAEVARITFDSNIVSYRELLEVFFSILGFDRAQWVIRRHSRFGREVAEQIALGIDLTAHYKIPHITDDILMTYPYTDSSMRFASSC